MPKPNRRVAFSTLRAMDAMNPSRSTPDFSRAGSSTILSAATLPTPAGPRRQDSLDNGPTPRHFLPIGGSLVPFLDLKVQRVVNDESQVPTLLVRGKKLFFDGACLAPSDWLPTGSWRCGGDSQPASAPCPGDRPHGLPGAQSPLWPPCSIPARDGVIGRDAPFLQDLSQPDRIADGVSRQRDWRQGEMSQQMG